MCQNEEFYVCIYSHREGDTILFHHEGGVEIGDVDAKVNMLQQLHVGFCCPTMDECACSLAVSA